METGIPRFDDLSHGARRAFGFTDEVNRFTARKLEDVVPVLEAAEAAADAGLWVAGFVSYEAAPALNSLLEVRSPGLRDPMRDLPLAHFQAFSTRVELPDIDSIEYPVGAYNVSGWRPDSTRGDYRESLAITGRAIMAGEIERSKHSFRLHAAFSGDEAALYRDLARSQRAPLAVHLDAGRFDVISLSPEGFFETANGVLSVRPVLSSVRRGRWLEEDAQYAAQLPTNGSLSPADRILLAETEVELSQLGEALPPHESPRISVDRMELMWHLTAALGVRLKPNVTLTRIFEVMFPSLSVTGVPKPEAMHVIARTEDTPRGVYCGAVGYLAPRGPAGMSACFSVAVRTVVVDSEEGVAEYGVGTAITNASDVVGAYEETRLKARILVDRRPGFDLVERFRQDDGAIAGIEPKLDILEESARYFGYEMNRDEVVVALEKAAANGGSEEIELRIGRSGRIEVVTRPAPPWCGSLQNAPTLTGVVCLERVSTENVFLFHKTTDLRICDAIERQYPGAEVVILLNEEGNVACSLRGNVAVELDGEWVTPPRSSANTAQALSRELVASGIVNERVVTFRDLLRADRTAVIDDIEGWRMVELLDPALTAS